MVKVHQLIKTQKRLQTRSFVDHVDNISTQYYYYVLTLLYLLYSFSPKSLHPLFHILYTTSQLSNYLRYYCYASLSHPA